MSEVQTLTPIGQSFLDALAERDFARMEKLFHPQVRFRGLVPPGIREGATAAEARSWFQRWFGSTDVFTLIEVSTDQVADRLHIAYRAHVQSQQIWQEIAQQVYCSVEQEQITDLALLCSGFRPLIEPPGEHLERKRFFDAGDQGCADGPLEHIAQLARSLRGEQTLEVRATNPSVACDLPSWCRMTGYILQQQSGDRYVISHADREKE